jgi:hypothetical protein
MRSFIICTPPSIVRVINSRRVGLTGQVSYIRAMGNVFKIQARKPPGKWSLGRYVHIHVYEDDIKINLKGIECERAD